MNTIGRPAFVPAAIAVILLGLLLVAAPAAAVSVQEEIDLGTKLDVQILKETPLSDDEQAQKDIQELGQRLAKNVRRPEIPYHFKVIKQDDLNAFAVPGGYIYFTERLWNVLRNDERTGVLAHEIAHNDRRHAIDAISKQQRRQIWLAVLLAAAGASSTWGDIVGLAESMYTLKYSRGDEQQADEIAVELSERAGLNPSGILLAMRKIQRFQSEAGGEPPKIFSSHPPTKQRLQYLQELLKGRGIAVPPETVKDVPNPHKIGEITAISGSSVQFTSTRAVSEGEMLWVMGEGWDFHYENRTPVPAARVVARTTTGDAVQGELWPMPTAKKGQVAKGAGVYAIPVPAAEPGVGALRPLSPASAGLGEISATGLKTGDRLLARQVVWNKDNTQLVHDNVGYLVVTDPARKTGYVGVQRPKYSYAPMHSSSVLTLLSDPDRARWVGPIISIGRGGQTIEVLPNRTLDNRTYDVAYPAWNKDDRYSKRVVGQARLQSTGSKVVLKMTTWNPGWTISDIQNGFDVYEAAEEPAEAPAGSNEPK